MDLQPRIQNIETKLLVGKKVLMSFTDDKTGELWQSFMPDRQKIVGRVNNDLICMQVYSGPLSLSGFNPENQFQKWALAEVDELQAIPDGMESYELQSGLYAVFNYKGKSSDFAPTFRYIFKDWLPKSDFNVDDRPHFEVLGAGYKNNDDASEEEIWIPVKPKEYIVGTN